MLESTVSFGSSTGNEDYLYPAEFFAAVELPQAVRRALRAAV